MKFNLILGLFVLGTFAAPEKSRSEIFNEHQKRFDDVGKSLSDYGFGMTKNSDGMYYVRVDVQGVKSLGGHFACLCRRFEIYEVKKKIVIILQKENGNTFTLFIIFIVKSLQKEQNSTNLLL